MRRLFRIVLMLPCVSALAVRAPAAVSSVSAWDAADFRIWGFVPYWVSSSTLNAFPADGVYSHVSDVLYFGGVRPKIDGSLHYISGATTELNTLKSHAAANGFRLHMSMFEVYDPASSDDYNLVWNTIAASPTLRATFVSNVKNLLQSNNMKGFNFDYERPSTDAEWANYTQLAKDMRAAINPLGMEVSVDDYGNTDSDWDDTDVFDAGAYDQLFIMGYHYGDSSNATFADGKLALTKQGADKAFKNEQLVLGVGTWGSGSSTKTLRDIVAATPNLAYNAGTWSDGTNTWTIESLEQVRAKTQLALDRNMPGMMSWTLHYDATNNLSLHRVMHHYMAVKRGAPDLNLDGKVNTTDATTLANSMGMVLTNTGMTTAAQFDAFYLAGNWEKGDRDGNGFVNQSDADWLASRYAALGVTLPDRLAYSGTFENFSNAVGLTGRWRAGRNAQNALLETSNFTQHAGNYLSWSGTGIGASKRSNSFVTIRNQNSAETVAGINSQTRTMQADLATSIDLGQDQDTYVTFLVRENTAPLSSSQLASINRTLTLDFLDSAGATQFDFAFRGLQHSLGINSVADSLGQDVVLAGGFSSNATYLFVGKISGNGSGANRMQASLFASGAVVSDFAQPDFQWMLTAQGSASFDPLITELQFTARPEANYTVSNIWIGSAAILIPPTSTSQGDFNNDGVVDGRDYVVWRNTVGQSGSALAADGNGNYQVDAGDYNVWRRHFGQVVAGSGATLESAGGVPEPHSICLLVSGVLCTTRLSRRRLERVLGARRD
jgi:hypothetical protein